MRNLWVSGVSAFLVSGTYAHAGEYGFLNDGFHSNDAATAVYFNVPLSAAGMKLGSSFFGLRLGYDNEALFDPYSRTQGLLGKPLLDLKFSVSGSSLFSMAGIPLMSYGADSAKTLGEDVTIAGIPWWWIAAGSVVAGLAAACSAETFICEDHDHHHHKDEGGGGSSGGGDGDSRPELLGQGWPSGSALIDFDWGIPDSLKAPSSYFSEE